MILYAISCPARVCFTVEKFRSSPCSCARRSGWKRSYPEMLLSVPASSLLNSQHTNADENQGLFCEGNGKSSEVGAEGSWRSLRSRVFCPQAHAEPPGVPELHLQLHGHPGRAALLLQRLHHLHRGPGAPQGTARRQWARRPAVRERRAVSQRKLLGPTGASTACVA